MRRWLRERKMKRTHSTKHSYGQHADDLIIKNYLPSVEHGFYVDVGCFHPIKLSNTAYFHEKGWHGINVDPIKSNIDTFNRLRPGDINVCTAVAKEAGMSTFREYNDSAISHLEGGNSIDILPGRYLVAEYKVPTQTLATLLDTHLPPNKHIDFMDIDVEGKELEILQSNNWQKYRPSLIIVEQHELNDLCQAADNPLAVYLSQLNYQFIAKMPLNSFFIDKNLIGA